MLSQAEITPFRLALNANTTLAVNETNKVLAELDGATPYVFAGVTRETLPIIVDTFSPTSEVIGQGMFRAAQENAGLKPSANLLDSGLDGTKQIQDAISYSTSQVAKGSTFEAVAAVLAGAMQKVIADYYRETIRVNSNAKNVKYRRVAAANACAFCMYAATEFDSTFKDQFDGYHNDCHCMNVPMFDDIEMPDYYADFEEQVATGVGQVRRDREIVEAAYRETHTDFKWKQFFATPDGSKVSFTLENYLREIRKASGRS